MCEYELYLPRETRTSDEFVLGILHEIWLSELDESLKERMHKMFARHQRLNYNQIKDMHPEYSDLTDSAPPSLINVILHYRTVSDTTSSAVMTAAAPNARGGGLDGAYTFSAAAEAVYEKIKDKKNIMDLSD